MATLLTHQVHQQQQSSNYNAPNNLHHTLLHQGHSGHQGAHHFCKDCGVMFESQTSLEVHLSYHKENLLTRWANQDSSLDKSSNSSIGSGSSGPLLLLNPSSPSPIKRERSEQNSSVESNASSQYFHSMDTHPAPQPHTYLPPMYNNNTGDQHTMEHHHSPTTPGSFLHHQQTPVDSNNGQQIIMYENFNFQQQGGGGVGHHPLFSPNPEHNLQQQQAARDSAEILDLDSHKVHIYQQQQQQQQQGFFHRPYLPHLLPPLPPPTQQGGGWNGEHHFSRFSPAAYPIEPSNAFYPAPTTTTAPPTNNGNGIATYEIVRMDNPDFSPNSEAPPPSHSFPSSNGNGNVPFGHHSPYAAPPQSTQQVKSEHGSPPGVVPKAQRSPLEGPVINNAKNGGAQSPAVKTKGWKGGECKRPKTYNCPACNKWFTSSGHLKRHYGTTLHKNSMKQLGENAEELLKQQPRKKGGGGGGNKGEPKAPKTPKAQKIRNNQISPDQIIRAGDEHQMKKEVMYGHENEQPMYGAPPPPSSPNSFNYHPYGLPPIIPPPTTNHLQQHLLQAYPPPPNNGNNYVLDFVPQQHQQPPPPLPPTTTYNNGFNHNNAPHNGEEVPNNSNEREGPLPPFSSVSGLSHYDPLNGMDTSTSSSFQQQNRVTPPYHPQQQQLQQTTPSPHNSHQGQADTSYDSLERSDPVSSGEGSLDGSLEDGLGGGGGGGSSSSSSGSTDGLPPPSKDLKEHFKQLHSNSPPGAPLFKCHTCGKRFPGEPALSDHLAKHGNDKPYKCELCPKQFNHKTDLNRHRLLHTGDRPFVCTQCGKGFIRKDHMSKHEETHRKKLLLSQPN